MNGRGGREDAAWYQEAAIVFAAFAPREEMRLYGRGIRRRLAPMLGGDLRHI
jgi:maltose alpha-D-glucosyltransferase / alpha-amylase